MGVGGTMVHHTPVSGALAQLVVHGTPSDGPSDGPGGGQVMDLLKVLDFSASALE